MPLPLDGSLHTTHQVGIAYWPEGLQYVFEAEYRVPLGHSQHVLLKDSAVSLIGHAELTPAFPRGGLALKIAPVAVWDITARAWGTYYFGLFSSVIPVDDPDFVATKENKQALADARVPGWGLRLDVNTRLKMKAGPVIAVVEVEARHHDVTTPDGPPPYFWEPTDMLVIPAQGWVIHRSLYLLEEFIPRAGPQDPYLYVGMYGDWSTSVTTEDTNLRFGPLIMWKPKAGPTWPLFYLGFTPWVESRFISTLPPYTFLAANWST